VRLSTSWRRLHEAAIATRLCVGARVSLNGLNGDVIGYPDRRNVGRIHSRSRRRTGKPKPHGDGGAGLGGRQLTTNRTASRGGLAYWGCKNAEIQDEIQRNDAELIDQRAWAGQVRLPHVLEAASVADGCWIRLKHRTWTGKRVPTPTQSTAAVLEESGPQSLSVSCRWPRVVNASTLARNVSTLSSLAERANGVIAIGISEALCEKVVL